MKYIRKLKSQMLESSREISYYKVGIPARKAGPEEVVKQVGSLTGSGTVMFFNEPCHSLSCQVIREIRYLLNFWKLCTCWVPQMLTDEHEANLVHSVQEFLDHYENEGESFLDFIVTKR